MSQRPQPTALIPVSLARSMPSNIATPPLDGMLVHRRVTPQGYVAGTHLYTWVERDKWSNIPCLRKQRDRRGLKLGPPDHSLRW